MSKIIGNGNGWDFSEGYCYEKIISIGRGEDIIENLSKDMIKTASSNPESALKTIADALASMGVKANIDIGELLSRIAKSGAMEKTASEKSGSSDETVKIASKRVEDSHFFIDVSKDSITKKGKSLILVSAYMREGYLGRYMIKRNYFFLPDNDDEASETYNELLSKAKKVRKRYHEDKIDINGIFPEMKAAMDAARGDIEYEEEERAGTTVYRSKETGHDLAGPPYIGRS